jgi:hypothetical protein
MAALISLPALASQQDGPAKILEFRIADLAQQQAALPQPSIWHTPEEARRILQERHRVEVAMELEMTVAARRLQVYRETGRLPDALEVVDATELSRLLDDPWGGKDGGPPDSGCLILTHCRQTPVLELSLPALIKQLDRDSASQAPAIAQEAPGRKTIESTPMVAVRRAVAPAARSASPKSQAPKSASVPDLIAMLASSDSRRRSRAADALGSFGSLAAPAVGELRRALADRDARVRSSAAMALGYVAIATPEVLQDLEHSLQDPSEDVRLSSRTALSLLVSNR